MALLYDRDDHQGAGYQQSVHMKADFKLLRKIQLSQQNSENLHTSSGQHRDVDDYFLRYLPLSEKLIIKNAIFSIECNSLQYYKIQIFFKNSVFEIKS